MTDPKGKPPAPWKPGGASLFVRTQGTGYTPGANRLSGKGSPAGRFRLGAFKLGR